MCYTKSLKIEYNPIKYFLFENTAEIKKANLIYSTRVVETIMEYIIIGKTEMSRVRPKALLQQFNKTLYSRKF